MDTKFDFNDILIEAAITTDINSRKEINIYTELGSLPLITAPMDTIIDEENEQLFDNLNIITCSPRGVENNYGFESYSLVDMVNKLNNKELNKTGSYLIDIANGHMNSLSLFIIDLKKQYPNIILMVGNVANPYTYKVLSESGADFIRIGVGNGNACSTTLQTGVGYPMGSLISECYAIKKYTQNPAKIVADGGMKNYSDVIKALALGADYVMVGSLFNKAIESCGSNYLFKTIRVPQIVAEFCYKYKIPVYKKFRGMSTKEVQKKWGKKELTTSEGVIRFRKTEYTLSQWVDNFEDYLRSAMSYSNAKIIRPIHR